MIVIIYIIIKFYFNLSFCLLDINNLLAILKLKIDVTVMFTMIYAHEVEWVSNKVDVFKNLLDLVTSLDMNGLNQEQKDSIDKISTEGGQSFRDFKDAFMNSSEYRCKFIGFFRCKLSVIKLDRGIFSLNKAYSKYLEFAPQSSASSTCSVAQ